MAFLLLVWHNYDEPARKQYRSEWGLMQPSSGWCFFGGRIGLSLWLVIIGTMAILPPSKDRSFFANSLLDPYMKFASMADVKALIWTRGPVKNDQICCILLILQICLFFLNIYIFIIVKNKLELVQRYEFIIFSENACDHTN